MFILDPLFLTVLVAGGIFIISYLLGKDSGNRTTEKVIQETIVYLCNEGFVRYQRDKNGEIEILKIEETYGNAKESSCQEKENS